MLFHRMESLSSRFSYKQTNQFAFLSNYGLHSSLSIFHPLENHSKRKFMFNRDQFALNSHFMLLMTFFNIKTAITSTTHFFSTVYHV